MSSNRKQQIPMIRIVLLNLVCFTLCMADRAIADAPWKAAAGSVVITPDQPAWMGGYAARTEPSQGKVHDLFAKALVIEAPDGQRLIVVTTDLLGITKEMRIAVEESLAGHGVTPESLLINASHTHCGPELRGERILRYGIDAEYAARARSYVRSTAGKIASLVLATIDRLEPSRLFYSHARAGFAMNRRLPTDSGVINSPNPDGPIDHRVPVLRVQTSDAKLTAVLFGYACHATTLSFQQLCGDYPGFAQQYIEQAHPGTVAMFLNGCSGDQNPYPRRSLELAQQHGRALANGVETALETKLVREINGPLRVAMDYATLKFDVPSLEAIQAEASSDNKYARAHGQELLRQIEVNGKIESERSEFPIQVVQFGDDLTLVALCGEVVVDYSLRLQEELATEDSVIWVAGYSNHVFGYLPSKRVLEEGGYEGGGAMRYTTYPGPFDSSVEDRVIEVIEELVKRVRSGE